MRRALFPHSQVWFARRWYARRPFVPSGGAGTASFLIPVLEQRAQDGKWQKSW